MTNDTKRIGLSRALKQAQLMVKELIRLGGDDIEIVKSRIEAEGLVRRIAYSLSKLA